MDNISVLTIQKYLDSKNIATGDGDTWKQKDVSWESQTPLQNSLKGQTQSLLHPSRPGLATPSPRSPLRQGRESLVGCHLWSRTDLDTTEAT